MAYYRDVSPEPAADITHNRLMTPPIEAADDDREVTLPILSIEEYEAICAHEKTLQGTPPEADAREGTLPVLSMQEYEAIRADESTAVIMLSLAVPRRGRGRPRKVRQYKQASYADVIASQFMMAALMPNAAV